MSKLFQEEPKPSSSYLRPRIILRSWRIHLDYFYIFGALGILVGLFVEDLGDRKLRDYALWLIAKGISMSSLFIFWSFILFLKRARKIESISLWSILTIGAAGGLVQALTLKGMIGLLYLSDNSSPAARLVSSALFAAIWLPAQSVTVINFNRFRKLRIALQDQLLEMEVIDLARKRLQDLDEEIIEEQIGDLVNQSSEEVSKYWEDAVSNHSKENLPEVTRALATEHLRVLAHEISDLKAPIMHRKHWWSLDERFSGSLIEAIIRSVRTRPLNAQWFVMVVVATVELPLMRTKVWPNNLYTLLIIAVVTYLIQKAGFILFRLSPKEAVFSVFVVTAANALIPFFFIDLLPGNEHDPRYRTAFAVILVLVTLIGHLAQAGLIRQEDLMGIEKEALENIRVANAQVNLELARITKKWAQHIHGSVQARLHAYSLVLEQAQLNEDAEGVERAIEEIRRTLRDLSQKEVQLKSDSLGNEVHAICQLWDGIVTFDLKIDEKVKNHFSKRTPDVLECVSEAITNAVRHGSAEKIEIEIFERADFLNLIMKDDGNGFAEVKSGLGSSVFATMTEGNWSLLRDAFNQKTILTLQFNLAVPRVGVEPTLGGF